MSATIAINDVEIAHLKLSYAHTRIRQPRQILELSESLLRCGQLLPIVVVAEDAGFVLIDGYQRVEAARRAGIDSLQAQIWPSRAPDAVCQLLASDGARQFDVLEQAALLRELKLTHRLSQNEIALRMGRHPSWVSRRLLLIEQLPAAALEAVRAGWLSSWSASRVLVPLARANPQHAQALVAAVKNNALSSRQLLGFWQHYQKANRAVRQKMAAEPSLFFKSLAARQAETPEGRWCRDLRTVEHILLRLVKTAEELLSPECSLLEKQSLLSPFNDASSVFELLKRTLRRCAHEKLIRPTGRDRHEPGRPEHPKDQPHSEDLAQDHPAHPVRKSPHRGQKAQPV
jgi:ParB/RepB/Spo0J family partition protein